MFCVCIYSLYRLIYNTYKIFNADKPTVQKRIAVRCSALQCVAMLCSALQCVAVRCSALQCVAECCSALQCVAVRCSALQCVAVRCSALQCVAACCSVLQRAAVCYNVLQCVARFLSLPLYLPTQSTGGGGHCHEICLCLYSREFPTRVLLRASICHVLLTCVLVKNKFSKLALQSFYTAKWATS